MAETHKRALPILRANWGSKARVRRVFAYEPTRPAVLVLWEKDGAQWVGETTPNELEAIDRNDLFIPVDREIRRLAELVVNDAPNLPDYHHATDAAPVG